MKKVFIMAIAVIIVTGCVTKYEREDIAKFVNTKLKVNNFEVSENYEKKIDENNYTDRLWTVVDKDNEMKFYVLDDHHWGLETASNELRSDYFSKLYLKKYTSIANINNITYNNEKEYDVFDKVDLICNYKNKKELNDCFTSLFNIQKYFGNSFDLRYYIYYEYSNNEYKSGGNISENMNTLNNDSYETALYYYYHYGISFQNENILNEMTNEDILNTVKNTKTCRIYKLDNDDDIIKNYKNVVCEGVGVSSETLYIILKEEGYNVTGNAHNYKVFYNNNIYEFSTEFIGEVDDNSLVNPKKVEGYYYLKNGEKCRYDNYHYNIIKLYDIKINFDLNLKLIYNQKINK